MTSSISSRVSSSSPRSSRSRMLPKISTNDAGCLREATLGDSPQLVGCQVLEKVEALPILQRPGLPGVAPAVAAGFGPLPGLFRLLPGEVRSGELGDRLIREVDLELEVLVYSVHQAAALGLDDEVLKLLKANVALVERAELHDHLLLDLTEDSRLAAFLERLDRADELLVGVGRLLLRLSVSRPRRALLLEEGGVGDKVVCGFDQVVRRRLGDPEHDHGLAPAPEQADERDEVSVAGHQHVGVHLRV